MGGQAVGCAAIRYFAFQIIYCDRANLLLRSAKQYAEAWLTVSPANVRMSRGDSWQVTVEKSPLPFFQGTYISCNDTCSGAHKSFPTTLFSMETDTAWFSFYPPTHKHTTLADKLGSNSVKVCSKCCNVTWPSSNSAIFLLISMLTFDLRDYKEDEKHIRNFRHLFERL